MCHIFMKLAYSSYHRLGAACGNEDGNLAVCQGQHY